MDIDPAIPKSKPSVGGDSNESDNIKTLDTHQQFTQWSDIAHKLEPIDEEYGESEDGSGGTRGAIIHSPQRRIQLARKGLSDYEQRLMGSVVDPQTIPTGFSQVCVKDETVTTLQEIITLPMLRPEYFSKGVLRRYGVSGILLFGPPGTGKTMLAKAVAKESGSVVLNIRASDIYDKYVGEGEKLAEAVFTLARKLAPCVIFIDEVDALFSARSSGEPNKFRRDIMNQIMSEWDGLNTSRKPGVMVMAATNRPFDLDDAILRRLPRRILVDLPGEDDRARILGIHLKGEELDSDVDLKAVAKRTESFSGSDLKNLCVAAAQAALRERVRAEDKSETIKLATRHFDAALKKVSPSSSDQMESLVELRKWDKIYGDGAQERKHKFHSIGFANAAQTSEEEAKPVK
ncbi:AAA-domain-containing protein [Coemansia reversa NRRL 1564]|uniref:AAA-domain-containing protein n=1 Tax=Coemansia reversa (strain ATCC 12441 / NRRL 1564) TaxID=763665 RepID=A0A2G5BG72_COERN|nr:AAA-domain-containing protein [Coemansia reversa NRRL 1564]|eukprot:PIA18015.1 AAA-domain-containing protein [Coemansia reversa NRRL 1564]